MNVIHIKHNSLTIFFNTNFIKDKKIHDTEIKETTRQENELKYKVRGLS